MEARAAKRKLPDDFTHPSDYRSNLVTIDDIPLELWKEHIFPLIVEDSDFWVHMRGVPILWKKLAQCYVDILQEYLIYHGTDSLTNACISGMIYMFIDFSSDTPPYRQFNATTNEQTQILQQLKKVPNLLTDASDDSDTKFVQYLLRVLCDPMTRPPCLISSSKLPSRTVTSAHYMPIKMFAKHKPMRFTAMVRHWIKYFGSTKDTPVHVSRFSSSAKHGLRTWPLFLGVGSTISPCVVPTWIADKTAKATTSMGFKAPSPLQLFPLISFLVLSETCSIAMGDASMVSDIADVLCSPAGYFLELRDTKQPGVYRDIRYLRLWKQLLSTPLPTSVRDLMCQSVVNAFDVSNSTKNPGLLDWLELFFDGGSGYIMKEDTAVDMVQNMLGVAEVCDGRVAPVPEIALHIANAAAKYDMPMVLNEILPVCRHYECLCKEDIPSPLSEWVSSGYLTILTTIVTHNQHRLMAPFLEYIRTTSLPIAVPVVYTYMHMSAGPEWDEETLLQAGYILHNPTVLALLSRRSNVQSIINSTHRRNSRRKEDYRSSMFPFKIGVPLLSGIVADLLRDINRSPRTWVECVFGCADGDKDFRCGLLFTYLEVVASQLSQSDRDVVFDAILSLRSHDNYDYIPTRWVSTFLPMLRPSLNAFFKHSAVILDFMSFQSTQVIEDFLFEQLSHDPYASHLVTMTTDAIRSLNFNRITAHILPAIRKLAKYRPHILEYFTSLCRGTANEAKKCAEAFGQTKPAIAAFLEAIDNEIKSA